MAANSDRPRRSWQRVDGVLLLDKSAGMTSNSALQCARRLYSAAKAGHTGTLDPLATGLLPLCFGEATKFSADLLGADKTYEADVLFGITTDTADAEGSILEQRPVTFSETDLTDAITRFRGPISQIPPMHSALKRDGTPLYRLARQGIEVVREPRAVTIHELTLLGFFGERCRLRVACSKGTYIRTLAADLGEALGCGAHLTALRRIAVGALTLDSAVTLEQLNMMSDAEKAQRLLAPDTLLQTLPAIYLDDDATRRFAHGNPVATVIDGAIAPGKCRVYGGQGLLGLGEVDAVGNVSPRRLVVSHSGVINHDS